MITFSILICSAVCTHARININYTATFQVHGSENVRELVKGNVAFGVEWGVWGAWRVGTRFHQTIFSPSNKVSG